ncbi:MAG: DUF4465 domain-containing protein [Pirellulales bacterium]|nr:DUF4465 domain-containing protein [Pirellulales bacterium]
MIFSNQSNNMLRTYGPFMLAVLVAMMVRPAAAATVVDFEDLGATLAADSAFVGADLSGGFNSQGAVFNNNFNATFQSWNGNAYSNRTSFAAGGFAEFADNNDTVSAPGTGFGGSATWGVANSFVPNTAVIEAPAGTFFDSLYVTNTRTTQFIIETGNAFADPFGGVSGNDPDLFTVRFNDLTPGGGGFVEFILADYRFADNTQDFVVDDWQLVDLTPLNQATRIGIEFTSTDSGPFGINTPAYVAYDNITFETAAVPEPASWGVLAVLGSAWAWRRRRSLRAAVAKKSPCH